MAWTDPRTWVSGETVTAALMNTHVRDNLKAIGDPWASYTPTWTASTTNPTIGNGTLTGRYIQVGKLIHFRINVLFGSTTSAGSGFYRWALPVTAVDDVLPVGTGLAFDTSATSLSDCFAFVENAETGKIRLKDHSDANVAAASPFTWANGDQIAVSGMYEAA